jgi:hypothetical protein
MCHTAVSIVMKCEQGMFNLVYRSVCIGTEVLILKSEYLCGWPGPEAAAAAPVVVHVLKLWTNALVSINRWQLRQHPELLSDYTGKYVFVVTNLYSVLMAYLGR